MKLRKFRPEDTDEIIKLHRMALLKVNVYRGEGVWEKDLFNINEVYLNNKGEFIVGVENGVIMAMGAFKKINGSTAEITSMRVRPDFQGKGAGKKILQYLEERARSMGYKTLILETDGKLTTAIKLYEKSGFTYTGNELIDGFNCLWYKKEL
ncbi:MAG TPA: GNAT family N-acetyltransferase [Spirochaetota bacterium]|nr:GNAT family N-acetyltransferase [Spirochaetota bacterium]HPJ34579.1 GNAT family N-acetyltransferase [Spirochaetota bacterium]